LGPPPPPPPPLLPFRHYVCSPVACRPMLPQTARTQLRLHLLMPKFVAPPSWTDLGAVQTATTAANTTATTAATTAPTTASTVAAASRKRRREGARGGEEEESDGSLCAAAATPAAAAAATEDATTMTSSTTRGGPATPTTTTATTATACCVLGSAPADAPGSTKLMVAVALGCTTAGAMRVPMQWVFGVPQRLWPADKKGSEAGGGQPQATQPTETTQPRRTWAPQVLCMLCAVQSVCCMHTWVDGCAVCCSGARAVSCMRACMHACMRAYVWMDGCIGVFACRQDKHAHAHGDSVVVAAQLFIEVVGRGWRAHAHIHSDADTYTCPTPPSTKPPTRTYCAA
jgi:hypothetical protein